MYFGHIHPLLSSLFLLDPSPPASPFQILKDFSQARKPSTKLAGGQTPSLWLGPVGGRVRWLLLLPLLLGEGLTHPVINEQTRNPDALLPWVE